MLQLPPSRFRSFYVFLTELHTRSVFLVMIYAHCTGTVQSCPREWYREARFISSQQIQGFAIFSYSVQNSYLPLCREFSDDRCALFEGPSRRSLIGWFMTAVGASLSFRLPTFSPIIVAVLVLSSSSSDRDFGPPFFDDLVAETGSGSWPHILCRTFYSYNRFLIRFIIRSASRVFLRCFMLFSSALTVVFRADQTL